MSGLYDYHSHDDLVQEIETLEKTAGLYIRFIHESGNESPENGDIVYVLCRDGEVLPAVRDSNRRTGWICEERIFDIINVVKWIYR